jgi:hypothetical protein
MPQLVEGVGTMAHDGDGFDPPPAKNANEQHGHVNRPAQPLIGDCSGQREETVALGESE